MMPPAMVMVIFCGSRSGRERAEQQAHDNRETDQKLLHQFFSLAINRATHGMSKA
jgi:hypothetical protein